MAKAYSSDLRLRAIKLIESKKTKTEVSALMGVTIQTLCKWWKLYKEHNIVEAQIAKFERVKKVNYQDLSFYVNSHPDQTLKEIGDQFNISPFGVLKILRKLGITYKKTLPVRGKTGRFERRISRSSKPNSKR